MWNDKEDSPDTVMYARRITEMGSALERMWEMFMGKSPNVMYAGKQKLSRKWENE